jgi:alkylation response protein AidB-like acyl-CoA dehydrogenase
MTSSNVNSTDRLSYFLYGGKSRLDKLKSIWALVENDPAFSKDHRAFMNHTERYIDSLRKALRFQEICDALFPDDATWNLDAVYDIYLAIDENTPLDVHLSMFIPVLQYHTSQAQREMWLSRAQRFRIIGAYAQTELGHGSNVRALETTATFDIDTDEFVINSPTKESTKFWPGGLGHTCTHAIVYARLIIEHHDYGVHPFMVPLRDMISHRRLDGIDCGDIGPKLGYNAMDNGYARFDHVRIPRSYMLNGFAEVSRGGIYSKSADAEKRQGGIMLSVRARIVKNSSYVLARAVVIAIRYSLKRRQGIAMSSNFTFHRKGDNNNISNDNIVREEQPVLLYKQQQRTLFPLLSLVYALYCVGNETWDMYNQHISSPDDASLLAELHCTSSGLKAWITQRVSEGMEACRQCCGGHGFLSSAGFQELMLSYLPFKTLEGTKEILNIQLGKWLVGIVGQIIMGKINHLDTDLPKSLKYLAVLRPSLSHLFFGSRVAPSIDLKQCAQTLQNLSLASAMDSCSLELISEVETEAIALSTSLLELFEERARLIIIEAMDRTHKQMERLTGQHMSDIGEMSDSDKKRLRRALREQAISLEGIILSRAAEAHSELLIIQALHRVACNSDGENLNEHTDVNRLGKCELLVMQRLALLLSCHLMDISFGDFVMTKCFGDTVRARQGLDELINILMSDILPHAEALVNAFQFSDQRLDSTLGNKEGDVYECIMDAVTREPLNKKEISNGYYLYLREMLHKPMPSESPRSRL